MPLRHARNDRSPRSAAARRHLRHRADSPSRDALFQPLENRLLLTAAPLGHVDVFNRSFIRGWAYSTTDGPQAVNVQVTINGSTTTMAANTYRADLAGAFGSPYHAFGFAMPTLNPGTSSILVTAVDPLTGMRTTLANATLTDPAPIASIDIANGSRIAGWVYDPDANGPTQIRIDIDGVQGTPTTTNVARPDVAAVFHQSNLGFDVSGSYAGHVVEVYAIDQPSGKPVLIYTNNHAPKGYVEINNGFKVAGWAYDPDDTSAHVNIRVVIDGVAMSNTLTPADVSRSDLTSLIGSPDHGFAIDVPGLTPGKHLIAVYALDAQAASAGLTLLGYSYVTDTPPTGHVDVVNSTLIKGWALDPDLGAGPATVSVYVDDMLYTTVTANQYRPDLTPYYGSANHGFTVTMSDLGASSHSITVTVHDDRTSNQNEIVIYDDFINNHQPQGSFDMIKNGQVVGWAWDPDAPGTPTAVDVYVDGLYSKTGTANITRTDLQNVIGSTDHGFAIDLPALSFGTHKIDLYAAESQGNVSTLIGSKTVTNLQPLGMAEQITATGVKGWAVDPDRLDAAMEIDVYVNGALVQTVAAGDTRNDLLPYFNSANHGFSMTFTSPLSSGQNQIDVYAKDTNNGLLIAIGSKSITV